MMVVLVQSHKQRVFIISLNDFVSKKILNTKSSMNSVVPFYSLIN